MSERLGEALLDLKTDDKGFRRGVDQAERHAQGLGLRLDDTARRAIAMGQALARGATLFAAATGAAAVKAASDVAKIGDEAARAGLGIKAFQELKYVAEQNRVGVDSLVDGIKELNLRADEFIATGQGSAAEAFKRLGYDAATLRDRLRDPSALFTEIIGKLGRLDKAAQIRIADEVFGGTGGEKFVQLIERGEQGIRDQIRAANDLGIVLDKETIARADELDRKFQAVSSTVAAHLKTAIVDAATALTDFINAFNGFEFERASKLGERMNVLGAERLEIERQIGGLRSREGAGEKGAGDGILGTWLGESTVGEAVADLERRMEAITSEEKMISEVLEARRKESVVSPPQITTTPVGASNGSARDKAGAAADREADAVNRLIFELQEELRLVGASDIERDINIALRRANVDAASKEGQQIAGLIRQIDAETAALYANRDALEVSREAAEFYGNTIYDALFALAEPGADAIDIIKRLGMALADAALQATLLGQGPLAGIFGMKGTDGQAGGLLGQLFSGFFAKGGLIPSGTFGIVGERGPEPVISTSRGAMVLPNSSLSQAASAGGATQFTARLIMPEGWRAEIVDEARQGAGQDTVQIVQEFEAARENRWQNGAAR